MTTIAETVVWHHVGEQLPDADMTVLIKSTRMDPPVWLGYLCGETWRSAEGFPVRDVTHWADIPEGPQS